MNQSISFSELIYVYHQAELLTALGC